MVDKRVQIESARGAIEQLRAIAERVNQATDKTVDDVLSIVQVETQANLSLTTHPPMTPTPSPPGSPPALIFGTLRRSIRTRRDPPSAPGIYSGRVGPTAIYGRIQELGGRIASKGRPLAWKNLDADGQEKWNFADHVNLPPRPFLKPAVEATKERVREAFRRAWDRALRL